MSAENELLRQIARQLDRDAPPISIDEIERRATSKSLPLDHPRPPRERRRRTPIVLAVAAVALFTVGLGAVLSQRSPAPTIRTGGTAVLNSLSASTEPATTVTTATSLPIEPATTAAVEDPAQADLDAETATVLAAIDADRIGKLRALPGFTATVVQEQLTFDADGATVDSQPGMSNRITLLADGSMWADITAGGFASYDPETGETRGVFTMADGSTMYQLIEGWTENSTGLAILLGQDPARLLVDVAMMASVEVGETSHDGRPAWRIDSTMTLRPGPLDQSADAPQTETYIVDQATGLIVASSVEWQGTPEQRFRQSSELVDLEIVSALPDEFPGEFPEGAQIDRSGDPDAFRPVSLSEAADWFGPGFVGPADVAPGTRIFVSENDGDPVDAEAVRMRRVEIHAREGFVTPWQIAISKTEPVPGKPIPESFILIDGALCPDVDDDGECDVIAPGVTPIASGALAGYTLYEDPSHLSLVRGGIQIGISGSSPSEFPALIDSFVAW